MKKLILALVLAGSSYLAGAQIQLGGGLSYGTEAE